MSPLFLRVSTGVLGIVILGMAAVSVFTSSRTLRGQVSAPQNATLAVEARCTADGLRSLYVVIQPPKTSSVSQTVIMDVMLRNAQTFYEGIDPQKSPFTDYCYSDPGNPDYCKSSGSCAQNYCPVIIRDMRQLTFVGNDARLRRTMRHVTDPSPDGTRESHYPVKPLEFSLPIKASVIPGAELTVSATFERAGGDSTWNTPGLLPTAPPSVTVFAPVCGDIRAHCSDSIDNDADGRIDKMDPGCYPHCVICIQEYIDNGGTFPPVGYDDPLSDRYYDPLHTSEFHPCDGVIKSDMTLSTVAAGVPVVPCPDPCNRNDSRNTQGGNFCRLNVGPNNPDYCPNGGRCNAQCRCEYNVFPKSRYYCVNRWWNGWPFRSAWTHAQGGPDTGRPFCTNHMLCKSKTVEDIGSAAQRVQCGAGKVDPVVEPGEADSHPLRFLTYGQVFPGTNESEGYEAFEECQAACKNAITAYMQQVFFPAWAGELHAQFLRGFLSYHAYLLNYFQFQYFYWTLLVMLHH